MALNHKICISDVPLNLSFIVTEIKMFSWLLSNVKYESCELTRREMSQSVNTEIINVNFEVS